MIKEAALLNKRAMVRWCRELGDNIYSTGAMFVQ
jgi:hypothetical protein